MSTLAGDNYLSSAQSRRFACDRCHQQKLRCERSPIMVDGGFAIPLGSCKRCTKAQVPCQTTASSSTGSTASGSKRKASPVESDKTNEGDAITVSSLPATSSAAETISCTSVPSDGSMFSMDAASLLDMDSFDFGTGDFTVLDVGADPSPKSTEIPPPMSRGTPASSNDTPALAAKEPENTRGASIHETPYEGFVDLALFGAVDDSETENNHSLSSHIRSSSALEFGQSEFPPATREDCRRKLLELHSTIFNDLHCITEAEMACFLFSDERTASRAGPEGGVCSSNSIISRVIAASESLIELLGMLRVALASPSGYRNRAAPNTLPRGSPVISYSPFHKHHSAPSFPSNPLHRQSRRPALISVSAAAGGSDSFSSASTSASSVDLPIIISLLTCYVGLLTVYRAVLTHVLLHLRSPEQQPRLHSREGLVSPRTASSRGSRDNLGGGSFSKLGGGSSGGLKRVLGIRIQMEVLTHMIERMEDAWVADMMDGSGNDDYGQLHHHQHHQQGEQRQGRGVLFGRPETMELLQHMLAHERFTCGDEGWRAGLQTLTGLLESIRLLLRGSKSV